MTRMFEMEFAAAMECAARLLDEWALVAADGVFARRLADLLGSERTVHDWLDLYEVGEVTFDGLFPNMAAADTWVEKTESLAEARTSSLAALARRLRETAEQEVPLVWPK